jgi:hypothetical protein
MGGSELKRTVRLAVGGWLLTANLASAATTCG